MTTTIGRLVLGAVLFSVCHVTIARAAPSAPFNLTATVNGSTVRLNWLGTPGAIAYRLEAGSRSGLSDLALITVDTTALTAAGVGHGTYYVRVRAIGFDGVGEASPEVVVTVGGCIEIPFQPLNFSSRVMGNQVSFSWLTVMGLCGPTGHSLIVGSRSGAEDLGIIPTGVAIPPITVNAPNGVYYVRLVATNASGQSAPSLELALAVPYFPPPAPPPLPPQPPPPPPPPPAPLWALSGSGDDVVDVPALVARLRISGSLATGASLSNFIVKIGARLLVNVVLTTANPTYAGTHLINNGGIAEVTGPRVSWTLTEVRPPG